MRYLAADRLSCWGPSKRTTSKVRLWVNSINDTYFQLMLPQILIRKLLTLEFTAANIILHDTGWARWFGVSTSVFHFKAKLKSRKVSDSRFEPWTGCLKFPRKKSWPALRGGSLQWNKTMRVESPQSVLMRLDRRSVLRKKENPSEMTIEQTELQRNHTLSSLFA